MIDIIKYEQLLAFAQKLTAKSHIDPYDILHEAVIVNPDCTERDIRRVFYDFDRANRDISLSGSLLDVIVVRKNSEKFKICSHCREDVPFSGFTYCGGRLIYCDSCLVKKATKWRHDNREHYNELQRNKNRSKKDDYNSYQRQYRKKNRQTMNNQSKDRRDKLSPEERTSINAARREKYRQKTLKLAQEKPKL